MRKVAIVGDVGYIEDDKGAKVYCWNMDQCCNSVCAAFAQMVVMKPDHTQDLVAVCAAMFQQIPIGILEEGKVAMPPGPSLVRG